MKNVILTLVCKLKVNPLLLILLGLALLLLLWLLRDWLFWLFLAYLLALVFVGLLALARIGQSILEKICRKASGDPKGQGSGGQSPSGTVKIPSHTYKRPDPMIYCQYWLMSKGLAVTWDNPDIALALGGAPVPAGEALAASTTYQVDARVWNGSVDAPAVNLLVQFYYLSFGIGTVRNFIGQTLVDLPVKGAPGLPAIATVLWRTPAVPGHYCLQAELVWPDDANPFNNLGQKNVNVKKLNSPAASFTFELRNDSVHSRTLRLEADSYAIPPLDPCDEVIRPGQPGGRAERDPYRNHRRDAYPILPGWRVEFTPAASFNMRPGETVTVAVNVVATDQSVAMQAVNVHAFADADLVGGVTLYVHN